MLQIKLTTPLGAILAFISFSAFYFLFFFLKKKKKSFLQLPRLSFLFFKKCYHRRMRRIKGKKGDPEKGEKR